MAPEYLRELVSIRMSSRNLGSSSQILLQMTVSRHKSYGDCTFSVASKYYKCVVLFTNVIHYLLHSSVADYKLTIRNVGFHNTISQSLCPKPFTVSQSRIFTVKSINAIRTHALKANNAMNYQPSHGRARLSITITLLPYRYITYL